MLVHFADDSKKLEAISTVLFKVEQKLASKEVAQRSTKVGRTAYQLHFF